MAEDNPDPYAPPQAAVADEFRPGSPVKAALAGIAVDIGGSFAGGIALSFAYGIQLASSGATTEDVATALEHIPAGSWVFVLGSLLGFGFSIWGGYVCARVARIREYHPGSVVATVSTLVAALLASDDYPAGINLGLVIATFGAVILGVRLGRQKNRLGR
jgi:hypothetical protein